MLSRLLSVMIVAVGALFLAGCGPSKLNENRKLEVEDGEAKAIDLPAVSKPQKVNVEFSSSEGEVSVYLFKAEDAKGDEGLLGSDPKKALASKKGKSDSFSADVPENTATRVIVRGAAKKTEVQFKITN
jgi:hypothetical protein